MKTIKISFKSGVVIEAPYSSKFYAELTSNMGKDHIAEHPSASIQTKDVQSVVYVRTEDAPAGSEA